MECEGLPETNTLSFQALIELCGGRPQRSEVSVTVLPTNRRSLKTIVAFWKTLLVVAASAMVGLSFINIQIEKFYAARDEAKPNPHPIRCRTERGNAGTWVQDWDYANRTHYHVYGSYSTWHWAEKSFQSSPTYPFRLATSWRWQDDHCPVQEISRESFCQVCWELGLTRFLIVGDSLSIQFMFSLISLLGLPPKHGRFSFRGLVKPFDVPCAAVNENNVTQSFQATIWMYKRSPAEDLFKLRDQVRRNQTNEPHYAFVQENPNKTAIVANLGAWMHGMSSYQEAFGALLEWLGSFQPQDQVMMFFRPTIPGHLGCQPVGNKTDYEIHGYSNVSETPYEDYAAYNETTQRLLAINATDPHNWMEIETYNDYSRHQLQNWSIHWLNVFPSSVLRRDGHVGYGNDCLHYALPGPTDWWVHFFHSMLWDIRQEEMEDLHTKESNDRRQEVEDDRRQADVDFVQLEDVVYESDNTTPLDLFENLTSAVALPEQDRLVPQPDVIR